MPPHDLPDEDTSLPAGGVRSLLRDLAHANLPELIGHLTITDPRTGRAGTIWIDHGDVYAAHMSGYLPPVAHRLRSAGLLQSEAFEALSKTPPAHAGPRAVAHHGVPSQTLEDIHREVLLATISHLYEWQNSAWKWTDDARTTDYITAGIPILLIVSAVDERIGQWNAIVRNRPHVVNAESVPFPGHAPEGATRTPEMEFMLGMVDGKNTVAQIAATGGFTRFEIARMLAQAAAEGSIVFPTATEPVPAEDNIGHSDPLPPAVGTPMTHPEATPTGAPHPHQSAPPPYTPGPGNDRELIDAWTELQNAKAALAAAEHRMFALAARLGVNLP